MIIKNQIIALTVEADRYTALAKDISLNLLKLEDIPEGSPEWATREKQKRKAQDHLLRAETFRTSIKLITGQLEPVAN
jgi:hypothetical protein